MLQATADTSVEVYLHPPGVTLPLGFPLIVPGDGAASLALDSQHAILHQVLPQRSRAEVRWIFDQAMRKIMEISRPGEVVIHGHQIDDDTLLTIALDLHHALQGRVSVVSDGSDDALAKLQDRIHRLGTIEREFRTWVNEDPSIRTSIQIAEDVSQWAQDRQGVEVEVLEESELEKLGLNMLLLVGRSSEVSPPRLVIARYQPQLDADAPAGPANGFGASSGGKPPRPLMLLGKGITFDSGGLNVKPYEAFISQMKNDMAGAALAFSLFRALVEGRYPHPLIVALPTCENAIDAHAMRPGALVKSHRGHTVRVDHTDAEGRLVLADALSYCEDRFRPTQVLSFATLTTAALIAYGPYATPVHFAGDDLSARLQAASELAGEDLHFLPERIWHYEANRDREADLRNTARLPKEASISAGSRNAAHFLKHFCYAPLCHFDIYGSAWNWAGDSPGSGYGATGTPLRTLLRAFGVDAPDGESLPGQIIPGRSAVKY